MDINDTAARIGCITGAIKALSVDADGYCGDAAHYLLAIEIMAEEARSLSEAIEKEEMRKRWEDGAEGGYLHLDRDEAR